MHNELDTHYCAQKHMRCIEHAGVSVKGIACGRQARNTQASCQPQTCLGTQQNNKPPDSLSLAAQRESAAALAHVHFSWEGAQISGLMSPQAGAGAGMPRQAELQ